MSCRSPSYLGLDRFLVPLTLFYPAMLKINLILQTLHFGACILKFELFAYSQTVFSQWSDSD